MLQTTRGIVFRTVKYSESSIIAKIYTEAFGMQSFMVRGLRSKKSTLKQALFQPFNLVEIVAYHRSNKEIQTLKEIKIAHPFSSIPLNIRKSTQVLFLNEVLNQVVREEEPNPGLFEFLFESFKHLEKLDQNIGLFHKVFLIQLTQYLGFFPRDNYAEDFPYFILEEGSFSNLDGPASLVSEKPFGNYISMLIRTSVFDCHKVKIPGSDRNRLLEIILDYYRYHIPDLREFKSHKVLQQVLTS